MRHTEYMTAVTDCYGPYSSELLEKITFKYIKERFKEDELEGLFAKIIVKVNPKYKTPPSPADYEEFFPAKSAVDIEAQAKAAYAELSRFSTMYPAVISDIRAQGAVELMGGWFQFNNYKLDEAQIHRNTFCKYYKQVSEDPGGIVPKILQGSGNWYKPKPPQLIGDREKCLQIAESVNKPVMAGIENLTGWVKHV
jgi:hypothetical protein